MISRDQAIALIKKYLRDDKLIKKAYAVENIQRNLAKKLNENEEIWSLTGLLHNIDYEYTLDNPQQRGNISARILSGLLPEISINAIQGINYVHTDYAPVTLLDRSLIGAVEITELIFEIINEKKKKNQKVIDIYEIKLKYKDKNFAPNIKRNRIKIIEDVGIKIEEFFPISLKSIIEIKEELEL